ncbi:hypothetical protein WOLCODRAFT_92144 [Wolfiporia cocos MD-104 SS10]|uniref:Uncharacterized protein n=1 Tax=Wolfiporia cocos (strain MD-104) TaxID=742152 RepID=A0A2H3JGK7_WOLCO|nr:hypothetical protein WOLCODRAFT_92144 [Wolfiporia cocos MD-104 SS10]
MAPRSPPKRQASRPTTTAPQPGATRTRRSRHFPAHESDHGGEDEAEDGRVGGEDAASEYEDEDEEDARSLHSDALDDDDDYIRPAGSVRKRKRAASSASPAKRSAKAKEKAKKSPRKKRRGGAESADESEDALNLKDGQEVVGVVVQAPKTGRVPPGRISRNTLDFLKQLQRPECNDREWCPVYRLAESEWKAFVDEFTPRLVDADPQIPHLPARDVIHRIYRDVRFSNDKTPYKTGFSASFSRSGRKGIFAHSRTVEPGNESLIAAGAWCPGKNELATIRSNLLRSSARLRRIIAAPEFVRFFGEPRPRPGGARQSLFGREDELKVAPKGVDKTHPDIDLLKCRSFAVIHQFADSEVLEPDFVEKLIEVVRVTRPFVRCMNDLMTLQDGGNDDDDEDGDESADEDGDENEAEEDE